MKLNFKLCIGLSVIWVILLIFIISLFYPPDPFNFESNFFFVLNSFEQSQTTTIASIIVTIKMRLLTTISSLVIPIGIIWGMLYLQNKSRKNAKQSL